VNTALDVQCCACGAI